MSGEIQIELSMLAGAVGLGVILRLLWNALELLRKIFHGGRFCNFCLDLLYWVAAAGAVYRLMYCYASGTLRGMILLFALCGILIMTAIDKKIAQKLRKHVKNG